MIYVATVHYKTERWIGIQLKYLRRHMPEPFTVYSCCNGIDGSEMESAGPVFHTDFGKEGSENHALNLNYLTEQICKAADPTDTLIFLDGDAFPIADMARTLPLDDYPGLAAVRRAEGPSPLIPHPSFCATTVGYWQKLPGSWMDANWMMPNRTIVNDTGSMLYKRLHGKQMRWFPLLRSNAYNLHPLFYGVYGSLIYHHGAGFRAYQLPGWGNKSSIHTVENAAISAAVYQLAVEYDDFYTMFTEGAYVHELKKLLSGHKVGVSLRQQR